MSKDIFVWSHINRYFYTTSLESFARFLLIDAPENNTGCLPMTSLHVRSFLAFWIILVQQRGTENSSKVLVNISMEVCPAPQKNKGPRALPASEVGVRASTFTHEFSAGAQQRWEITGAKVGNMTFTQGTFRSCSSIHWASFDFHLLDGSHSIRWQIVRSCDVDNHLWSWMMFLCELLWLCARAVSMRRMKWKRSFHEVEVSRSSRSETIECFDWILKRSFHMCALHSPTSRSHQLSSLCLIRWPSLKSLKGRSFYSFCTCV